MDYTQLMDSMYEKAIEIGPVSDDPNDAWIKLPVPHPNGEEGVWWPNPNYSGPSTPHPENENV